MATLETSTSGITSSYVASNPKITMSRNTMKMSMLVRKRIVSKAHFSAVPRHDVTVSQGVECFA